MKSEGSIAKELKRVNRFKDRLGKGIDKPIKELVAILNLLGFPTIASCAGHIDHAYPAPWVDIKLPGQPRWRHKNEQKIYARVARKYNVSFRKLKRGWPKEVWLEAVKAIARNKETKAFIRWRKKNEKLAYRLQAIVNDFYRERGKLPKENKLIRVKLYGGGEAMRLYNGKADNELVDSQERAGKPMKRREKIRRFSSHLKENRGHMEEFTKFLMEIYARKLQ